MSEDRGAQSAPEKGGTRFVFIGKSTYSKSRKKPYIASTRKRRSSSTSSAELFQVMAKVRKHPEYKKQSENQIKEEAENLTTLEYFRDYFSEFNEHHVEAVFSDINTEAACGLDVHESTVAGTRAAVRLAETCNINVKLQLRKLDVWNQGAVAKFASLVAAEYGPTHAALLIGNSEKGYVILEWDGTSLVIPQHYHSENSEDVVFEANVASPLSTVDKQLHDKVRVAGQELDYERQIDLVFDAGAERSKMFDALFNVVIKYNKYYQYHMFSRNCQHFVQDAMKALKIQNPDSFTGRLKEYFEKLKKGVTTVAFESHSDLDTHVKTRISEATQHELEFYTCMYLHFHAVSRSQSSKPDPTKWKCEETTCQFDDLDVRIAEQESVLNRFLQQSHNPDI